MTERLYRRRTVLRGATVALGATLAGCTGGGDEAEREVTKPDVPTIQDEPAYEGWFTDVSNYRGTYDFTDRNEVSVAVGAPGNGGNFAFEPAAIAISTDTTVVWDWTGKDGPHNVVAKDGTFESETKSGDDAEFSYTFTTAGNHRYLCEPHVNVGMKGAVVVRR